MKEPVLILGATSDIGFAIARTFAAHGHTIWLCARSPEDLSSHRLDLINRFSISCDIFPFDASDLSAHGQFPNMLPATPHLIIYSIGYMHADNASVIASISETSETIMANYTGAVTILNAFIPHLKKQQHGGIIGIASVAGLRGRQSNFIYGSAKAGFIAYLSGVRNMLYSSKVHVMTVLPGFVRTKMTEHLALNPMLTASPEALAKAVYKGWTQRKNTMYYKPIWRLIMWIIQCIPEFIFKKMRL